MTAVIDYVYGYYAEVVSDREGCKKYACTASLVEVLSADERVAMKYYSLLPFQKGQQICFWNLNGDVFYGWNKGSFVAQVTDFEVYADFFDGSDPSSEGDLFLSSVIQIAPGVYSSDMDFSSGLSIDDLTGEAVLDSFAMSADFNVDRKIRDVSFVPVVVGDRQELGLVFAFSRMSAATLVKPVGVKLFFSYNVYVPKDWDKVLA